MKKKAKKKKPTVLIFKEGVLKIPARWTRIISYLSNHPMCKK